MAELREKLMEALTGLANTIADAIEGEETDELEEAALNEMVEGRVAQEKASGLDREMDSKFLEEIGA